MEVWRFCCYLQIVDCISVEVGTIDFLPKVFSVENQRTYLNPYFKNIFFRRESIEPTYICLQNLKW